MKRNSVYVILVCAVFFFTCRKDVGKINRGNYPDEIGKIIGQNCSVSGCHNSESYKASADFDLSTWETMFKGSDNGSPVIPFNSEFSSLCYFINTYPELGIQNSPTMPLNKSPMPYETVKKIKDWINQGAPDISGRVNGSDPELRKLYAVNQGCDVVTVFNAETQLPIRYVKVGNKPTGNTPHQVHVSPDGKYWYVSFLTTNILQKFDCRTDQLVGNIPLTPFAAGDLSGPDIYEWNTFVISSDSKYAYCASLNNNGWISKVDLENMTLLKFRVGLSNPHGIALSEADDVIYATSQYGNSIYIIDSALTNPVRYSLNSLPPNNNPNTLDPHELFLSHDKKNLLISCQASNEVRIFSLQTNSVTNVISTGIFPQEIMYSEAKNQYFVACTSDDQMFPNSMGVITRIDGLGFGATHIPCGYQPHGMAVDDRKGILYVLSRNTSSQGPPPHHTSSCLGKNGFVNFIDLNTFKLLSKKYELSVDPYYIALRP
ncbi:MAG: hypothetical protein JNL60_11340 [Bacteroidia bacterium]|nr:hypothetical protein [Bacteroidia bacterium]